MSGHHHDGALALQLLTFIGLTLRHWDDWLLPPENVPAKVGRYCYTPNGQSHATTGILLMLIGWAERSDIPRAKAVAAKAKCQNGLDEHGLELYRLCYEAALHHQEATKATTA